MLFTDRVLKKARKEWLVYMKKKIATTLLILIIIISAAIPNKSYAEYKKPTGTFKDAQEHQEKRGEDTVNEVFEEQKATVTPNSGSRSEDVKEGKSSSSVVAGALGWLFSLFPNTLNGIITLVVNSTQTNAVDSNGNPKYPKLSNTNRFTIEDLVMGKYYIFNINFTEYSSTSTNPIELVKQNIGKWYFSLRNIAIVGNLILLVYLGIRMAISTVATEQARYKKMFSNWLASFVLIFTMHYVFIIVFEIQEVLISLIGSLTQGEGFEEQILNDTFNTFAQAKGWNGVVYVMEMLILAYYQIKFFIVYSKRFFTVGFLFTISPLITLADAIYSVSSRVPIFRKWLREILYNIFLQVIHATVYAVFILSAASIAKEMPIIGMLLLMTLSRSEKIIKTTFGLNGKGLSDEKLLEKIKQRGAKTP